MCIFSCPGPPTEDSNARILRLLNWIEALLNAQRTALDLACSLVAELDKHKIMVPPNSVALFEKLHAEIRASNRTG